MRTMPFLTAGLLALLSSAAVGAELPVVKETEALQGGCLYTFKVLDDSAQGSQFEYPAGPPWRTNGKYKLIVQTKSVSYACRARAQTVELSKAFEVPDIALQVGDAGLVVAYTRGAYHPWVGYTRIIDLKRLEPLTLSTLKATDLYARYGQGSADYAPGALSLSGVTLYNQSLEVTGGVTGTTIWGGGSTQTGSGSSFAAGYLDFFGDAQQAPGIVIY